MKHGKGLYIYKHVMKKKREKGLNPKDVLVDKMSREDETVSALVKGEKFMEAAKYICSQDNSLNLLNVFYVLQYGPYPFYAGQFKENQKHGRGVLKHKDGSIYVGNWMNNKRHGQGEMYYSNGDRYVGQWAEGLKHGEGTYHFVSNHCLFEGTWEKGQLGMGFWKMCDGNFYYGHFEENQPEGAGEMWFTDDLQNNLEAKVPGRMRAMEWIPSPDFDVSNGSSGGIGSH